MAAAYPIGRFAPTPSGRMHLGNVFAALIAWLSVRSKNGEMVLDGMDALLALQILAVSDAELAAKLDEKRAADAQKVLQKDAALQ